MKDHRYSEEDAQRAFDRLDQRFRREQLVPKKSRRSQVRLPRWYAVAAGVLLLVASVLAIDVWVGSSAQKVVGQVEKVNPPGRRTRHQLPDGTRVWLNVDSRISYPAAFASDQRAVYLRGEAFFAVTYDAQRPFVIRTPDARVQVLGTTFNVKVASKHTEAVVVDGSVSFGPTDATRSLILRANDRAVLDPTTGQTTKTTVDAQRYVAWTDGTLIFEDQPLNEVILTLEKWYDVRFTLDNPVLGTCQVTAKFENLALSTVLDQIQFIIPIRYRIEGKRVFVDGQPCPPKGP